jgi:hypothetical protein
MPITVALTSIIKLYITYSCFNFYKAWREHRKLGVSINLASACFRRSSGCKNRYLVEQVAFLLGTVPSGWWGEKVMAISQSRASSVRGVNYKGM